MADLDLRRLRHFLTLAEELNYGRAAAILHLAQPALSRSIATLERELGVVLFDRSRSGTRLAPAGEILRDEARQLLRSADTLKRRVREGRTVTIGFAPGLIVTPVVRHLEERFPELRVEVVRTSWGEQITGLRDGSFDASYAHRPFDDDGLVVVELFPEPRLAALPVGHRCAGRDKVSLDDLAGEVLLQPVAAVPEWRGRTGTAGTAPTVEEKFELVAAGRGIIIVPDSVAGYYRRPDLSFVPVADLPHSRVCLVVEARRNSAVLQELVRFAGSAEAVQE
jgi:DNA-binding transcriptional LysR family regulator